MKTEVRNEFILEAHKSACSEWKLKIEKECPELFKSKLEVGKWYKSRGGSLAFCVKIDNKYPFLVDGEFLGYGFDYNKKWQDIDDSNFGSFKWTLATEEEVKEALIKEAKKRGFKKYVIIDKLLGCNVGSLNIENKKQLETNNFTINANLQFLYCNNLVIFRKGKWAEIISNPIEEKINDLQNQIDELKKQL